MFIRRCDRNSPLLKQPSWAKKNNFSFDRWLLHRQGLWKILNDFLSTIKFIMQWNCQSENHPLKVSPQILLLNKNILHLKTQQTNDSNIYSNGSQEKSTQVILTHRKLVFFDFPSPLQRLRTSRSGQSDIFGGTIEVVTSIPSKRGENPRCAFCVLLDSATERKDG